MRDELPALTTWRQIGLIFATPSYNDGAPFLDEGDMADIARLLDEYKAARDAERDAAIAERNEARAEADKLRVEVERLRQGLEDIGCGDYAADPEWKARELIGMND